MEIRFEMYYKYCFEVCLCFQNAILDIFFLISRFMVGVFLKIDVGTDVWYSKRSTVKRQEPFFEVFNCILVPHAG